MCSQIEWTGDQKDVAERIQLVLRPFLRENEILPVSPAKIKDQAPLFPMLNLGAMRRTFVSDDDDDDDDGGDDDSGDDVKDGGEGKAEGEKEAIKKRYEEALVREKERESEVSILNAGAVQTDHLQVGVPVESLPLYI